MKAQSLGELRRRAETRVGPKVSPSLGTMSITSDSQALIYELQVHQVELEMQNEELRRAKTEAEDSRNKYLELFDTAPVGYVTLDRLGRIQEANLTFAAFVGRSREELLGQPFRCQVTPERRQALMAFCRKLTTAVTSQTCELQLIGPKETVLDVQVKGCSAFCSPTTERGQARLVIVDVTAQRQAEREQGSLRRKLEETQKLESLGVLAGGIAHDFNNLLTGILGNACLIRSELPNQLKAWTHLEQIIQASGRAAELCKQMLDYSGKGRLVVEAVNLNALISDTTPLLQVSTSKNVLLAIHPAPLLPNIGGDATQLRQVLMNLVINASEAVGHRNGTVTLTTGLRHADAACLRELHPSFDLPEGRYVCLEVRDDGCGMSQETLTRIFDPFFTTKLAGRGLGLAAVLGIVRGHNGAIRVTSQPGCGTIFTLLFPALRQDSPALVPPTKRESAGDAWRGQGTVLVIEDDEAVRNVAERMLKALGFDVVLASDGQQGLELFRPTPDRFCAVLLDLSMPYLNGQSTLREMRRICADTPVILMSGFNEENATEQCEPEGPSGFLQKPFRTDDLRQRLRAVLR